MNCNTTHYRANSSSVPGDPTAAGLASSAPAWKPGTQAGYHAVTYGWLVGELVRRIDGRTLGTFFREEVTEPLGLRTAIGVPIDAQGDLALVHSEGMDTAPLPLRPLLRKVRKTMRDPSTLVGKASMGDGALSIFDGPQGILTNPRWLAAEIPASNGVTSAHDLARLFAMVACDGELDGTRFVSKETLARVSAPKPTGMDTVLASAIPGPLRGVLKGMLRPNRTLAFMGNDPANGPQPFAGASPRSVGAGGYGGQLVFADPDRRLSFAFVRSTLLWSQKEVKELVTAVYEDLA